MEDSSSTINIDNAEIQGDSKPKTRRKTSDVWNNFTNEEPDKDGKNVKCNQCLKRWKYEGTKMGTSTFSRHMLVCKKKPNFGDVGAMLLNHDEKLRDKCNVIDPKIVRDLFIKVSVAHNLPLKWVEFKEMRVLLKYLNPSVRFICRNTHALDVMNMYESEKEKLRIRLNSVPGMLCLTSDIWTACTNSGYMCLTAHYVDEKCKLDSKLLAFRSMPPPHSAPESHDEVVRSMSLLMKSKFEKYWEDYSDILSMGAVFDPRMKLKLVEYC
ncbi:hypothetical protein SASPL_141153 [Salvia splendens]|uniref:BED-type domain-containing protein n=1 Tax=Salvia splendens TaxID=180675 RepID=A0A8X8ZC16_SALSN|nr:hypothetical protein SASPL_141153 [Salvia splendens]